MSVRIIKPGVLDTVQDTGRYGSQHKGINPGGAMDRFAAEVANYLVGNDGNYPVIEMHFPPSAFMFEKPALISVCGADFKACINGDEVPICHPLLVNKNALLHFRDVNHGARAYLAIHGGFNIPKWLGSYSTNLKAGTGGYRGRALQKEDLLHFQSPDFSSRLGDREFLALPWKADLKWRETEPAEVLCIKGNEWDHLGEDARANFMNHSFYVSAVADRMGYRLAGPLLSRSKRTELVSSAVSFGTVQVLPDGQLIILMADHQTTGGYPRVAHVVTADLPILAQARTGQLVKFRLTDMETAETLLVRQRRHLHQLKISCAMKMEHFLSNL